MIVFVKTNCLVWHVSLIPISFMRYFYHHKITFGKNENEYVCCFVTAMSLECLKSQDQPDALSFMFQIYKVCIGTV